MSKKRASTRNRKPARNVQHDPEVMDRFIKFATVYCLPHDKLINLCMTVYGPIDQAGSALVRTLEFLYNVQDDVEKMSRTHSVNTESLRINMNAIKSEYRQVLKHIRYAHEILLAYLYAYISDDDENWVLDGLPEDDAIRAQRYIDCIEEINKVISSIQSVIERFEKMGSIT